jgi:hypothetical protein
MVLSIAAIGSCRIHDPLRKAREQFGFVINRSRSLGFTHSSPEAVQQLKFLRGEIDIPEVFWPCVSNVDREEVIAQKYVASNIYVVELSSEKQFKIGDTYLQLNYFGNHFAEFFSDADRKNCYRRMIDKATEAEVASFLKDSWSGTPSKDAERNILQQVRFERATEDTLRSDIRYLRDTLPRVLFVTHVNALDGSGNLVKTRSRYIDLVKLVARQEGCAVYDPTYSMQELGQTETIDADINHFTESFKERVVKDMFDSHLHQSITDIASLNPNENAKGIVEAYVAARLTHSSDKEAKDLRIWLKKLARKNPEFAAIRAGDST